MERKTVYLILALAGLVLPYAQFVPWLMEHGLEPMRFVEDLFANRIAAFFGLDVIVSAVVLLTFIDYERRERPVAGAWPAILGTVTVGVSFGLPLYLYLRETRGAASPR